MGESDYILNSENILDPPEKMRLMYEAVSELVKENREISSITVKDITSKAGIGKGTAYEYFESKDLLIAYALLYEYSQKIQALVAAVFQHSDFKSRVYSVMDWVCENAEYNQMFTQLIIASMSHKDMADLSEQSKPGRFIYEANKYVNDIVNTLMEDGFKEGVYSEEDATKRRMVLLTNIVEYCFVKLSPMSNTYQAMEDEALREFIYSCILKSLN